MKKFKAKILLKSIGSLGTTFAVYHALRGSMPVIDFTLCVLISVFVFSLGKGRKSKEKMEISIETDNMEDGILIKKIHSSA